MDKLRRLLAKLKRPSTTMSLGALLLIGVAVGVFATVGFNTSLHVTNTESFCLSCHEMAANPYVMLQETVHFHNKSGVRPTCSDCHVPREFIPKMIRKIEASREVWGHLLGTIDTAEKYAAYAPKMKAREVARLRANDSQECRNCHEVEKMILSQQTVKAQEFHLSMAKNGKTCIDCHAGIAHTPVGEEPYQPEKMEDVIE